MGKHTSKADQQRLVERWRETDTWMATFVQANGVYPVTFGPWIERYALKRAQTPQFLPIAVGPQGLSAVAFTVRLDGYTLTFYSPPPAWFAVTVHPGTACARRSHVIAIG